ncbi:MAG: porin [Deltaproteobacteria bacterium]|nr:porin [Deltaproteobacteria bacterium]
MTRLTLHALCIASLLALFPTALRAEEEAAEPAAHPTSGYDKGFFIRSADGSQQLTLQGRIQARFATEIVEDADPEAAFSIPRARVTLKGKHWAGKVSTKLQLDFGKGGAALKDALVDFKASKSLKVAVGQYKKPFSRQQLTSSGKLAFVDRAITDKAFGAGRDIGLMLHNDFSKSPTFEWAAGVFNGTGDKARFTGDVEVDPATGEGSVTSGKFSNVPSLFQPTLVLRAGYNHGKLEGYSEADLEGGGLRFGVAASLASDVGSADGDFVHRQSVDAILKIQGFSCTGELFLAQDATGSAFGDLAAAALGARLQAGYTIGGKYYLGARWALVDPAEADDADQELLLVLTDFSKGHGLKYQLDGGALLHGDGSTDILVRAQLQLSF